MVKHEYPLPSITVVMYRMMLEMWRAKEEVERRQSEAGLPLLRFADELESFS